MAGGDGRRVVARALHAVSAFAAVPRMAGPGHVHRKRSGNPIESKGKHEKEMERKSGHGCLQRAPADREFQAAGMPCRRDPGAGNTPELRT